MTTRYGTEPVEAPIWFASWNRLAKAYATTFAPIASRPRGGNPPTVTNIWLADQVIKMPGECGGYYTRIGYEHTAKNFGHRDRNLERFIGKWCGCSPPGWSKEHIDIVRACPYHNVNLKAMPKSSWFAVNDEISRRRAKPREVTQPQGFANPIKKEPDIVDIFRASRIIITVENPEVIRMTR